MGPIDPNASLEDYRGLDNKEAVNAQGERIPEKETLNNRFVSDFLGKKGITPENFDRNFTLTTAIEMTSYKHSKGEDEMYKILSDAQNFLVQNKCEGLLEPMNELTAKSDIHRKLDELKKTDQEARIQKAYNIYRSIKMHCDRIFKIREQSSLIREQEKTKVEKGVKEDFAGVIEDAKKNFGNLESKEKMLLVVGGIIGAAMLMGSDSPRVGKIRETIFTCLKIGGVAWLGNTLVKVFTGKSALQTVSDWSKSNVGTESFWTKVYKTNAEKAEILRKSTIYMGDKDFMYLAQEYKTARDTGKKKVSIPSISSNDMDSDKIYTSLDVFFTKYPVEGLMQKYAKYNPRPKWREVVGSEMIDDKSIQMDDSLISRTGDAVHSAFDRSMNWIAPKVESAVDSVKSGRFAAGAENFGKDAGHVIGGVGRGAGRVVKGVGLGVVAGVGGVGKGIYEVAKGTGKAVIEGGREVGSDAKEGYASLKAWAKETYRKTFGEDASDDKVWNWYKESLDNWVDETDSGAMEKFIREHNSEKKKADGYVEATRSGTYERKGDVDIKYVIRGDNIYLTSNMKVPDALGANSGMNEAVRKTDATAREFLKQKYPQVGDNIDKLAELTMGGWIKNDASYQSFLYMPLPGTFEFNERKAGRWTPDKMKMGKDIETFGEDNKFEYQKMSEWDQQILRLRFYLDSTQLAQLKAVCDKYNSMYQGHGLSISVVRARMFGDSEDAKKDAQKVLEALTNSGELDNKDKNLKLAAKRGILEAYESKISTIEKDAKGKIPGNDSTKMAFEDKIRRAWGYSVRLALLGDTQAMKDRNYNPNSKDSSQFRTPDELLEQYEIYIKEAAKRG